MFILKTVAVMTVEKKVQFRIPQSNIVIIRIINHISQFYYTILRITYHINQVGTGKRSQRVKG